MFYLNARRHLEKFSCTKNMDQQILQIMDQNPNLNESLFKNFLIERVCPSYIFHYSDTNDLT
uniref:Uncharacterized protein n=1 Tax=Rhizophora mucronata TaxID=61149 RepID=A0A2P2Q2P6_RHIMU